MNVIKERVRSNLELQKAQQYTNMFVKMAMYIIGKDMNMPERMNEFLERWNVMSTEMNNDPSVGVKAELYITEYMNKSHSHKEGITDE